MLLTVLPTLAALALAPPDLGRPVIANIVRNMGPRRATVNLELFIAPDREVLECRVLDARPPQAFDDGDCGRIVGRKVSKAANGPDGQPIHGVTNALVAVEGGRSFTPPADFIVEVEDLPGDSPAISLSLVLIIDPDGAIAQCQEVQPSRRAFAEIACQQAGGQRWPQRYEKSGEPISYLTAIRVDFVESS